MPLSVSKIKVLNARVPGYAGLQAIFIDDLGMISHIEPVESADRISGNFKVLDVGGDWVSLGGIDVQINGGLGLAFPDLSEENAEKLEDICRFLWEQGVDGFLPTLVTTSVDNFQRSLAVLAEFMERQKEGETAKILGVHLEGPFLNFEKRGAHPAEFLLPLNIENVKRILGDYGEIVKVMTLAPELPGGEEVIAYLRSKNIIVSLGHSLATASEAEQAFEWGASMVTHAFNAMPSLHHRQPGLLAAAMVDPRVACGFIADGEHVSPLMLDVFLRSCGGAFLVSDALAPVGLPDGFYPWDTRKIEVKNGTCRLPDGTLAGTTLPLLVGVQNLVKWGICEVEKAIFLATEAPRKALGMPGFSVGRAANLLRWNFEKSGESLSWQRLEV
ncbi:N-acetylglucosamine-6-phosphate deacetylase [Ancylothrix sp. C2]|uniref:N-acetylglucosamine-6-phosphate deacetylase n=1 Tax=Ancylothrix sp. D3o TaxID=2953691 RepID=UPI0021BB5224|nr:N-acetylglucosamine-6-phosphate deacetylase [Ancylothrix sp. D3o]MCT7948414.1 N-acetylglucosamine-6-phosphate deacetylase [Ancylothrix sp. D3o]